MKYVFTITAGRTGTAWLTQLFDLNFECKSVHEYLQFGDIGRRSPDIGVMQAFNHWGNNMRVQQFWKHKLAILPKTPLYVETNHALAKCGLIENLDSLPKDADVTFVMMKRDWVKQAMSYINRHDFVNYTTIWQWYLDPRYALTMVPFNAFKGKGQVRMVLWYIAEVEARQAYYKRLYGDKFKFVEAKLEDATTKTGATELLSHFGHKGAVYLPEKANASVNTRDVVDRQFVRDYVERIKFDADSIAERFIDQGLRLGSRESFAAVAQTRQQAANAE